MAGRRPAVKARKPIYGHPLSPTKSPPSLPFPFPRPSHSLPFFPSLPSLLIPPPSSPRPSPASFPLSFPSLHLLLLPSSPSPLARFTSVMDERGRSSNPAPTPDNLDLPPSFSGGPSVKGPAAVMGGRGEEGRGRGEGEKKEGERVEAFGFAALPLPLPLSYSFTSSYYYH